MANVTNLPFGSVELDIVPAVWYSGNNEDLYDMWCKGRDFKMIKGPYLSVRDVESLKKEYHIVWLCDHKTQKRNHMITL